MQSPEPGRKRANDRHTLNGILFVLKGGCTWEGIPRAYGSPTPFWRRLQAWTVNSTWGGIWRRLLSQLDVHSQLSGRKPFWTAVSSRRKKGDRHRADEGPQGLESHDCG
jgi:transposase